MGNIFWRGSGSVWLGGEAQSIMENRWEVLRGGVRPEWVKYLSRWPTCYHATVPGTRSHTVILLSPWALVATQWYSPASWVRTPLICRDELDSTFTLPVRAWMTRPARCQVKLWRMEPSTWQDSMAMDPTGEVTLSAGFRTGEGSVKPNIKLLLSAVKHKCLRWHALCHVDVLNMNLRYFKKWI